MEDSNGSLQLLIAAETGNVDFLLQALLTKPDEYFLATVKEQNIIHHAVNHEQAEFLKQVLDRLPNSIVQHLLCQQVASISNYNAFHIAVLRHNLTVVQLLVKFAKQSTPSSSSGPSTSNSKPWLALDNDGMIPFQVALTFGVEDIALELMTLDLEWICQFRYNSGASHLVEALRSGYSKVAKAIMNSGCSYSTEGEEYHPICHCCAL